MTTGPLRRALLPSALLLAFAGYFSFDIVTLRKALYHADIFTYYYPFRQWFVSQLMEGRFPLWNPYWGLGHGVEAWASIPLDLYTPLEILVGPYYHHYQAAQLLAIVAIVCVVLVRLGSPPLIAAAGAIVFFMSPLVTYWYFSFLIGHVYIAHALLFLFIWEWSRTGRRRYLFLVAATTAFGMLGTKLEFWFYQSAYFAFLALLAPAIIAGRPWGIRWRPSGAVLAAMAAGIVANAWQLDILLRLVAESGRVSGASPAGLLNAAMYRNLLLSAVESPLWQMLALGGLAWLALVTRGRRRLAALAALAASLGGLVVLGEIHFGYAPVPRLANASFEEWTAGPAGAPLPRGFTFTPHGPGCAVEKVAPEAGVRHGQAALLMRPPRTGGCYLRAQVDPVERLQGRHVRVSLWARGDNTAERTVQADLQDGVGPPRVESLPVSRDWRRVVIDRQVDPRAPFFLVTLNVTDAATAPVVIDAMEMEASRGFRSRLRHDVWLSQVLGKFATGPVLPGAVLGLLLSVAVLRDPAWRGHARTAVLFLPLLFYWCRPWDGTLDETQHMDFAPPVFIAMLAALGWLGCRLVATKRLAAVAHLSILFVFFMRDQGQIVLAHAADVLWMPTRDNYIIDFAVTLLATIGLASLVEAVGLRAAESRVVRCIAGGVPLAVMLGAVLPASGNLYYVQPLMQPAPPGYPFYGDVPALRSVFRQIGASPPTRVYLASYDARGFTYGFGSALLERVGQITMYSSLTSRRYKDWTVFHRLGIRPEQQWGGYPGNYGRGTLSRLPRKNTLGRDTWAYYHHTVIARPPIRSDLLALLGVSHVAALQPTVGPEIVWSVEPGQLEREIAALAPVSVRPLSGIAVPWVRSATALVTLRPPLPRAYLVHGVTRDLADGFQRELSPRILDGAIATASHAFPIVPAAITRYEPERVEVEVTADRDAVLVLGDLHHPFWTARVDGRPAEIFPALHLFRGVRIPPGRHRVEFVCRVPWLPAATALSLIAVACGAALCLLDGRRQGF